jgi:hypothetical protein
MIACLWLLSIIMCFLFGGCFGVRYITNHYLNEKAQQTAAASDHSAHVARRREEKLRAHRTKLKLLAQQQHQRQLQQHAAFYIDIDEQQSTDVVAQEEQHQEQHHQEQQHQEQQEDYVEYDDIPIREDVTQQRRTESPNRYHHSSPNHQHHPIETKKKHVKRLTQQ